MYSESSKAYQRTEIKTGAPLLPLFFWELSMPEIRIGTGGVFRGGAGWEGLAPSPVRLVSKPPRENKKPQKGHDCCQRCEYL